MKKLTFLTAILLATTTFAQVPNYVPTNGLVGWWPFNGNANDESGNGNHGTVTGAILTSDRNSIPNSAYNFFGSTDNTEIITGDCSSFPSGNSPRSISIWYYGINTSTNSQQLLGYGGENCGQSFIMNFNNPDLGPTVNPSGKYEIQGHCQLFRNYASSALPLDNYWHQITLTYDGSIFRFYNDGYLVSTSNPTTLNVVTSLKKYCFGKETNQSGTSAYYQDGIPGFNGKLDDIGIWNRALTDCEIKNLYNGGVPNSSQTQTALDTYTWPVNNQTYTQSGTYSDTLVNAAGCDSIVTLNLTLSYTGINELNASQLVVSPNPTKDNFSISGLELLGTITSLEIKDATGKVVKVLSPTTTNFSCIGLKAGVYFLAINSNKTERVIEIIKE